MPSPASLRQITLRSTAVLAASGLVAFAAACGGGSSDSGSSGGSSGGGNTIEASTGKEIFQKAGCVSCHTLADGGGSGRIGPNLDDEKPSSDEVVRFVTEGDGRMPSFKDRLSTAQIQTLADYVAEVAGK